METLLLVGASGTIGAAIAQIAAQDFTVVTAARRSTDVYVDLSDPDSIRSMYAEVGTVDHVVSAAGAARFAPLLEATDDDWDFSLHNKLLGQINLVRFGVAHTRVGGSITLTTGVLGTAPIVGSSIITTVNAGLVGFISSAALELADKVRVNAVSPGWVRETLESMGRDPGQAPTALQVADTYLKALREPKPGRVLTC